MATLACCAAQSTNTEEPEVCYRNVGCFSMLEPWNRMVNPRNSSLFAVRRVPAPSSPRALRTRIVLYTRATPREGSTFYEEGNYNIPQDFNTALTNYFIVHGYARDGQDPNLHAIKNGLLDKHEANVFMVTWGTKKGPEGYAQSVSDIRVVGAEIGMIVANMRKHMGDKLRFHLLGHGLGAHLVGYAGKEVILRGYHPVDRITGMDPSAIGFSNLPPKARLDIRDATFVDVIHTNTDMLGAKEELGDVDFYMNGGRTMPDCEYTKGITYSESSGSSLLNICSHFMAASYVAWALTSKDCTYWGTQGGQFSSARIYGNSLEAACLQGTCSSLVDPECLPARGRVDVDTRKTCTRKDNEFLKQFRNYRRRLNDRVPSEKKRHKHHSHRKITHIFFSTSSF
ncbi:pancreatic lipase-related protein 2 isoform X2 [Anabrus simplex]|uniref:pancreatic lipase-related protein 2 isoform X2 n=1 Tax=Anabrus simplex TaxID=316456 RepID=UPI0035A2ED30